MDYLFYSAVLIGDLSLLPEIYLGKATLKKRYGESRRNSRRHSGIALRWFVQITSH